MRPEHSPDPCISQDMKAIRLALILLLVLTSGCQTQVSLMPTPLPMQKGLVDPFVTSTNPETKSVQPRIQVFYATNRLGINTPKGKEYLTLFDRKLRLGVATLRFGKGDLNATELHRVSTTEKRTKPIPIKLIQVDQIAEIDPDGPSHSLTAEARKFFSRLNHLLASSEFKDLIVYIHGANNTFYRTTAHAAQFRHFTGRNAVILAFAWPSAASLLHYAVDVNNAARTVPVFVNFLRLLSQHAQYRHLDLLAYSAGAQILSPALSTLAKSSQGKEWDKLRSQLRLGEVYFAAPDLDLKHFLYELATYIDLVEHVTIAVNPDDSVLYFAALRHGRSRAGRPDPNELSPEETQWVAQASRNMGFDILWVEPSLIPGLGKGGHSFWYSSPWVSTDILIQLLLDKRPAERGLIPVEEADGTHIWTFPPDYPERLTEIIQRLE